MSQNRLERIGAVALYMIAIGAGCGADPADQTVSPHDDASSTGTGGNTTSAPPSGKDAGGGSEAIAGGVAGGRGGGGGGSGPAGAGGAAGSTAGTTGPVTDAGARGGGGTTGPSSTGTAGSGVSADAGASPTAGGAPTFTDVYSNILVRYCAGSSCHDPGAAKGIGFASRASAYSAVRARVKPGDGAGSSFFKTVNSGSMPRGAPKLSPDNLAKIRAWIDAGALDN